MDNNCVKYHPNSSYPWKVYLWWSRKKIAMCKLWPWPWPWRYYPESRSWYDCVKYHQDSTWQWRVMTQIRILECVHCDLDLGDMTLSQCHDTPFGYWQQLCEILWRSNLAMKSYGLDTDFGYVCTVTLTLEIWPWVMVMTYPWVMVNNCEKYYLYLTWQWGVTTWTRILGMCELWPWPWEIWPWVNVMTHPWVMDNNCLKYYPARTRGYKVVARTLHEQTDKWTDMVIPKYPQT